MIRKLFIDSDVILDVALGRKPFVDDSKRVLALIEGGLALGVMSANSVTNMYYVLRKISSASKARFFLRRIIELLHVVSVDHENIKLALESKFQDFEDGVQNYCALKNQCDYIVTRNTDDYMFSELETLEPREIILLFNQ